MIRVLALHGFGQNAELFVQKRAKDLLKKLKSAASVTALDAPHVLPYDASLRGWWLYPEDLWDGRAESIQSLADHLLQRSSFQPIGLDQSLTLVMKEWTKGYDAIIGFSQGAILAAALCARLLETGQRTPRFAIFLSGFGAPTPEGVVFPKSPMPIPSLHMWGDADEHIPPWASKALAERFQNPQVHSHPGHHIVPQKAADMNTILSFIETNINDLSCLSSVPKSDKSISPDLHLDELRKALRCYRVERPHEALTGDSSDSSRYTEEELSPPGPGTYERLVALLKGKDYASMSHGPCRTSEDAVQVRLAGGWKDVTLHSGAKAMLLRTPKGEWLLAVLPADGKVSWKKLRSIHGKGTRIATEEEVREVTGCLPGAVPPIAAAFPCQAAVLADVTLPEVINFNCGLRTRSIQIRRSCYESVQAVTFADIME